MNGKNLKLRARRKKNGECIIYKESQWQHVVRLSNTLDPKKNPKAKINPADVKLDKILKLIGLYLQARFGDNKTPKPSIFDPGRLVAWDAWNKNKGMSVKVARERYI